MRRVNIYKAQGLQAPDFEHETESVEIAFYTVFPDLRETQEEYPHIDLKSTEQLFQDEAELLERTLRAVLPGGTYDRLFALMCARKASDHVVAHREK